MKRLFTLLLCLVMVLSLLPSMTFAEAEETTQTMTEEEAAAILKERRDTVYNTMLSMANVLWRATEDVTYYFSTSKVTIVKGRLYRGMPYTYGKGTLASFMEFAGEPNEKGEYSISGLTSEMLDGSSLHARIGNSCSGAAVVSYGSIGASVRNDASSDITTKNGFIPVGPYKPDPETNANDEAVCAENGLQVMFQSYAQAQYADLVVCSGHTMMTQKVNVVYKDDGTIDGDLSTMTVVHQNPDPIRNNRYFTSGPYSEANYGEKVYRTFLIDDDWTFQELFNADYMPYTCKELIDPSPIEAVTVSDTETEHSFSNILTGVISSNRFIDCVTMTITDENGQTLQQATARTPRSYANGANRSLSYDLAQLRVESPMKMKGTLNINLLGIGKYHCRLDVRLMSGETVEKVRDFDFTVTEDDLCEGWVDNSNLEFTEVDGKKMAVCPVCGGDPVEWTELPQITSHTTFTESHYYVAEDLSNKARYSMPKSTVCVHLNGHNITSTSQVFWLGSSSSMLNVMGNGTVKGSYTSDANGYGATMHFSAASANAALYGGTYGHTLESAKPTITMEAARPNLKIFGGATLCRMEDTQGANIEVRGGTVELRDGRILDGTNNSDYGGNVRVYSSEKRTAVSFTMYGGIIAGGRAKHAGNVFVHREEGHGATSRIFTMEGGLIHLGMAGYAAGSAGLGGNIYAATGAEVNLNGGIVTYGKSYKGGGNIHAKNGAQITVGNTVENGNGNHGSKDTIAGGNIYLLGSSTTTTDETTGEETTTYTPCKLTVTGTVRNNLGSIAIGGNIFCSLSDITVDGGTIENGVATSRGGNIYITNAQGDLILKNGGKILNGSAPNGGNVGINIAAKITIESGEISGGTATTAGPDVRLHAAATVNMTGGSMGIVYGTTGKFTLSGDSSIKKLTMTTGTLKLDPAWKGSMDLICDADTIVDNKLTKVTCGDTIVGKVTYNSTQPVFGREGSAYLANASVGDSMFLTAAEAVEAAGETDTVKLYTDAAVTADKDLRLDINGHAVTADCTGTVYASDSTATTKAAGTGTLTTAAKVAKDHKADGVRYIALNDGNTYTFHALELKLNSVSLRTSQAGIYYKGQLQCDPQLAAATAYHGIALSVAKMPGANFAADGVSAYTRMEGAPADIFTSGSVFNIFKEGLEGAQNAARGETAIFANGYLELKDGTVVMASTEGETVSMSLKDVMTSLNDNFAAYEKQHAQILEFYRTWKAAMSGWALDKIAATA